MLMGLHEIPAPDPSTTTMPSSSAIYKVSIRKVARDVGAADAAPVSAYFCRDLRYSDNASMSAADSWDVLPCVSLITWM